MKSKDSKFDCNGRPRANSAPAGTLQGVQLSILKKHNGIRPEYMKRLLNGKKTNKILLNGKVSHIYDPYHDYNCSGQHGKRRLSVKEVVVKHKKSCESHCCKINVLLVTMQLCIGLIVTGLGVYMQTLTSSLETRETPYWAGIPLFLAGACGLYFCIADEKMYSRSNKVFFIKAVFFCMSTLCMFVCIVASIFPGIHGSQIAQYHSCDWYNKTAHDCVCTLTPSPQSRVFHYKNMQDCEFIYTSIKDYLILQCAFNAIACGVSMWLVFLLWRTRYAEFHSGLRFYSYSANIPQHPWVDPQTPPYSTPETPSFQRKLSQKRLLAKNKHNFEEVRVEIEGGKSNGAVPVQEQSTTLLNETSH